MIYKQIPFNMTIAKRINDGCVLGRVSISSISGSKLGNAIFTHSNPYGDVFTIIPDSEVDHEHTSAYMVPFDNNGFSIAQNGDDKGKYRLIVEIPVKDNDDNCSTDVDTEKKDAHYHKCKIEPIEYILANDLDFCQGNIVKYITRYKHKGTPLEDLRKIKEYVQYIINNLSETDVNDK